MKFMIIIFTGTRSERIFHYRLAKIRLFMMIKRRTIHKVSSLTKLSTALLRLNIYLVDEKTYKITNIS